MSVTDEQSLDTAIIEVEIGEHRLDTEGDKRRTGEDSSDTEGDREETSKAEVDTGEERVEIGEDETEEVMYSIFNDVNEEIPGESVDTKEVVHVLSMDSGGVSYIGKGKDDVVGVVNEEGSMLSLFFTIFTFVLIIKCELLIKSSLKKSGLFRVKSVLVEQEILAEKSGIKVVIGSFSKIGPDV